MHKKLLIEDIKKYNLCSGCGICSTVCPYDAIYRDEEKEIAVVNEALCTGCGTCSAVCPSSAIQQFGFNDDEVLSEIKAILGIATTEEEPAVVA